MGSKGKTLLIHQSTLAMRLGERQYIMKQGSFIPRGNLASRCFCSHNVCVLWTQRPERGGDGGFESPRRLFIGDTMTKYLLNSAVLTSSGLYSYRLITPEKAREWYGDGADVVSTIGYPETAEALSQLLGRPVPVNRITISMQEGDEALVFRLVLPAGSPRIDPKDKGQIANHVKAGHWELGLLRRLNPQEAYDIAWVF